MMVTRHVQQDTVVSPAPPLPPVQFWLPGFPAYKMNLCCSGRDVSGSTEDDRRRRRHRDHHHTSSTSTSVSSASSASSTSHVLQPPPPPPLTPPVFLAFCARGRACRIRLYSRASMSESCDRSAPTSARNLLCATLLVCSLGSGSKVVGAEAGGLGMRGEMWSLSYIGFQ